MNRNIYSYFQHFDRDHPNCRRCMGIELPNLKKKREDELRRELEDERRRIRESQDELRRELEDERRRIRESQDELRRELEDERRRRRELENKSTLSGIWSKLF
ncbi:hypothetical protein SNE40_011137 [Patella caerulea]|uniref:Uncharacterized protein n=1 Tax=Patella caerulea TaxID=87958 RepID=A0AAN8JXC1_PATCE